MSRRVAVMFLFSAMFVVSAWAGAVSFIQDESVSISQAANRLVTITYQLKGKPGIVTVDILTNGVSIGEYKVRLGVVGNIDRAYFQLGRTNRTVARNKESADHALALADEAAIELFENQLAQEEINTAQDEALIELYEIMEGA